MRRLVLVGAMMATLAGCSPQFAGYDAYGRPVYEDHTGEIVGAALLVGGAIALGAALSGDDGHGHSGGHHGRHHRH
jgi:uncharacterized membrane protein